MKLQLIDMIMGLGFINPRPILCFTAYLLFFVEIFQKYLLISLVE